MCALYDLITPSVSAEKKSGEWQHVDVTLYRRHLTVVLNGVKIIDKDFDRCREIAELLNLGEGAVKSRLSRGRQQLRRTLTEEWDDEQP